MKIEKNLKHLFMLSVVVANLDEIFNSIFFLKNKELATKYLFPFQNTFCKMEKNSPQKNH